MVTSQWKILLSDRLDAGGNVLVPRRAGVASRQSDEVSELGATPGITTSPSAATKSRPYPLGRAACPGCIISLTSTMASALPAAVVIRASAVDESEHTCVLDADAQRPSASRVRQPGLRRMSLAVKARRSPADSTIRNSGVVSPGWAPSSARNSVSISGIGRLILWSAWLIRGPVVGVLVDGERDRCLAVEDVFKEGVAVGVPGAMDCVGIGHHRLLRQAPQCGRPGHALGHCGAQCLVEDEGQHLVECGIAGQHGEEGRQIRIEPLIGGFPQWTQVVLADHVEFADQPCPDLRFGQCALSGSNSGRRR